jgi:outer membrane immunogenic protein
VKRLTLSFCVAAAGAANALAADLPVKAPMPPALEASWAGFYLGAGVGFRASKTDVNVTSATDTTLPPVLRNMFVAADCFAGLPCVTGNPFNGTAFRVSPYLGYNWQIGPRWVAGLEGDFGFADQTTSAGHTYPAAPFLGGSNTNSFAVKTTWDASIRGRVGYLVNPALLLYGTGGASWLHLETTSNCSTSLAADGACAPGGFPGLAPASITQSNTRLGYTVGAGAETMLWPNWIARAEYRFADYGRFASTDVRTSALGVQTVSYDTKIQTHTATFGLAYKFGDATRPAGPLSAFAAVPPVMSWTGFYAGAAAGLRANHTTSTLDKAIVTPTGLAPFNALNGCGCFLDSAMDGSSARVSPYVGYLWQFNPKWVAGLEGDFGFANQRTTQNGNFLPGTAFGDNGASLNNSYSIQTKWDASIRARVGYLVTPTFLTYLTGGAAWMSVEETSRCSTAAQFLATAPGFSASEIGGCAPGQRTPVLISQSTVRPGYTIGAGGEVKLGSNWIARAEYRFADFGTARFNNNRSCAGSTTLSNPAFGTLTVNCFETDAVTTAVRLQTHNAMFGIAYQFN